MTRHIASLLILLATITLPGLAQEPRLSQSLGRNEVRVLSAPYIPVLGTNALDQGLIDRLERRGYQRVGDKPRIPGQYFWGREHLWVYRRAYRYSGEEHPSRMIEILVGRRSDRLEGLRDNHGGPLEPWEASFEPMVLAEDLEGLRGPRPELHIQQLPEHVWKALLAIEDHRFFAHQGVDGRAVARAALTNLSNGSVRQGGSTITQQLIKMRELSAKRSYGRKASEALRALALEAEVDKDQILESYLDIVYLGHIDGLPIHGYAAAARAWFGIDVRELDLAQSALLAAMVQAPNRLNPRRNPEEAESRRNLVLDRLAELDWIDADAIAAARQTSPVIRPSPAPRPLAPDLVRSLAKQYRELAPRRAKKNRGVVIETAIDDHLQYMAERFLITGIDRLELRRGVRPQVAFVAFDLASGQVVASVGGDPSLPDGLDRSRASRQPGSVVKPFIALEAFSGCPGLGKLSPASRLLDERVEIELPSGIWAPQNADKRFAGPISLRKAVGGSRNVPMVRLAQRCGFARVERRFRRAGLVGRDVPGPAFTLGAVERTPLQLASAISTLFTGGQRIEPILASRFETPTTHRKLSQSKMHSNKVAEAAEAYLAADLLATAVTQGTASRAAIPGTEVWAKTGTSQDGRDAWVVGVSSGLVAALWLGNDEGSAHGFSGGRDAAPIWATIMSSAVASRKPWRLERPKGLVDFWIDPDTGLRVDAEVEDAEPEIALKGHLPPKDRFFFGPDEAPILR